MKLFFFARAIGWLVLNSKPLACCCRVRVSFWTVATNHNSQRAWTSYFQLANFQPKLRFNAAVYQFTINHQHHIEPMRASQAYDRVGCVWSDLQITTQRGLTHPISTASKPSSPLTLRTHSSTSATDISYCFCCSIVVQHYEALRFFAKYSVTLVSTRWQHYNIGC